MSPSPNPNPIRFETDAIGNVEWAFFSDSIFSLARFQSGTVFLVANATKPDGRFITITNPEFDYAETVSDFHLLAKQFQSESTG